MSIVGPTKLILLRAGKFEYAEVELVRPLHLVGPNNVGKTSLIATLQFLYVDDQRHMHFSREMDETRRYYFPDRYSYVLFECLTPTGYQVVGVQGLGPLKQYGFQRFAYRGNFALDDYIDDQRVPRSEEAVRARLSDRSFTLLEPRHLQAALTGIGDGRGVHLGLAPIKNRDQYGRFRRVFCNLLRLSHLSQEELKRFLFDIYHADFQQRVIDLEQGGYASQYERVRKGAKELQDLQSIAEDGRRLLGLAGVRAELRRDLPGLWRSLREAYAREESAALQRQAEYEARRAVLQNEDAGSSARRQELQDRIGETDRRLGVLDHELRKLEEAGVEFADYVIELEQAREARLAADAEELGLRLREAGREPPGRVRARIGQAQRDLAGQTELLGRLARVAATRLKALLGEATLEPLFRLFNPALLGLTEGAEGLEILAEELLKSGSEAVLDRIADGLYRDEALRIALAALPPPDIAGFTDPGRIAERIEELKAALERDRSALQAAEEAEELRRRKAVFESELTVVRQRLLRYGDYRRGLEQAGAWRQERDDLAGQEAAQKAELERLINRQQEISDELRTFKDALTLLEKESAELRRRLRALAPPDPDWGAGVAAEIPAGLEEMLSLYGRLSQEERGISIRVAEGLQGIEGRTYCRYRAAAEAATLQTLAEELEALQEREAAVQKLWSGLAADLRRAFKSLGQDLETLKSRVDELNRQLAKVSVSNLTRLRLLVRENAQWMQRIRTVVEAEDVPLFADPKESEKALDHLGELLRSYRRVELLDLFDLNFEVTTADGGTKLYRNLESIESNGTTITIKVLVNLMLLQGLLDERKETAIPFYLDEASSLDRDNLFAIVGQAREMGFIPVLASPEAVDAADHLYFIREQNGRVVLEPKSSLVRIVREKEGNF